MLLDWTDLDPWNVISERERSRRRVQTHDWWMWSVWSRWWRVAAAPAPLVHRAAFIVTAKRATKGVGWGWVGGGVTGWEGKKGKRDLLRQKKGTQWDGEGWGGGGGGDNKRLCVSVLFKCTNDVILRLRVQPVHHMDLNHSSDWWLTCFHCYQLDQCFKGERSLAHSATCLVVYN